MNRRIGLDTGGSDSLVGGAFSSPVESQNRTRSLRRLVVVLVSFVMIAPRAEAQTTYRRAVIDTSGQLRLTTSAGKSIVPPKDSGQVGFQSAIISDDRRSVGWLALYPNCCTTYPIPQKLVVRTPGRVRVFDGSGFPIWRWAFIDDAKLIAYRQAPVHGDAPAHYELRDLDTGKLVDEFDAPVSDSSATQRKLPLWVRLVDGQKVAP